MKMLETFKNSDGAKYGVSDFYSKQRDELIQAINTNEDFSTGWYSVKKELFSAIITRKAMEYHIEVRATDDFNTIGKAKGVYIFRDNRDHFEETVKCLDGLEYEAEEDRKENRTFIMFSIHRDGKWIESYLYNTEDEYTQPEPPGEYYDTWGWQGDSDEIMENPLRASRLEEVINYMIDMRLYSHKINDYEIKRR